VHNFGTRPALHLPKTLSSLQTRRNRVSHHRRRHSRGAKLTYFINSKTTARGVQFLKDIQQPEGGWPGYWGICFTYATMFALQSLCLAGETYETSDPVRRACDYLVSKQRADGGWGESYKVCDLVPWRDIRTRLSGFFFRYSHPKNAYGLNTKIPRWFKRPGRRWHSCTGSTHTRGRSQKLRNWSCRASCRFVV
jgi:hypothetical protein